MKVFKSFYKSFRLKVFIEKTLKPAFALRTCTHVQIGKTKPESDLKPQIDRHRFFFVQLLFLILIVHCNFQFYLLGNINKPSVIPFSLDNTTPLLFDGQLGTPPFLRTED